MIKKTVDIYVPLMNGEEYTAYIDNIDNAINELLQLSGKIEIKFNDAFISLLYIKKLNKRNKEIKVNFDNTDKKVHTTYLKFSTEISVLNKKAFEEKKDHYISFEYFVKSYVKHLIIYLNLAKPGAFDTREGLVKTSESSTPNEVKISEFPMLVNSFPYAIEIANKSKWPPIKNLPITETLNWLDKHWQAFEIISVNKIQRALNAYSYLFHDNLQDNSPNDLFHSLIGVEAIFVKGNSNIQDQVNQKSQILLGKRNEFKKIFSELYDYRSRYIHGQLNFINKYFVDDRSIAIDQMLNTSEKSAFAEAILISAIQKHIEMDCTEFEYELILKKIPS